MRVKICGLTDARSVAAAAAAGASWLGFVHFPPSPRNLPPETAAILARGAPPGPLKVALTVDADDALIDRIAASPFDLIQLHGRESPARVAEIRARSGRPVMKSIGVGAAADLAALEIYEAVADRILCDARPPPGGALPGGNGLAFDWRLISGRRWRRPWMLAGGLTADNVEAAIRLTGAEALDVSSGVESAPGVKDAARIAGFIAAAGTGVAPSQGGLR